MLLPVSSSLSDFFTTLWWCRKHLPINGCKYFCSWGSSICLFITLLVTFVSMGQFALASKRRYKTWLLSHLWAGQRFCLQREEPQALPAVGSWACRKDLAELWGGHLCIIGVCLKHRDEHQQEE